jgi:hypothetical protein
MHAFFEMNVFEVDGLLEAIGIIEVDSFVFGVEPGALAVVLVNGAIDPTMAVEVGELGLL